jgi:Prokaryotic cytochrome b561
MSAAHVTSNARHGLRRHGLRLHPLPVRIMHWINAFAMIIMIMSGWKIYDDDVIFSWLRFPDAITLGKWAQNGLQWHFFAMWIVVLNGLAYLLYGTITGRFRSKLFPVSWRELIATMRDALTFRLRHDDLTHYNAVQKLLYIGIMLVGIVVVLSGPQPKDRRNAGRNGSEWRVAPRLHAARHARRASGRVLKLLRTICPHKRRQPQWAGCKIASYPLTDPRQFDILLICALSARGARNSTN